MQYTKQQVAELVRDLNVTVRAFAKQAGIHLHDDVVGAPSFATTSVLFRADACDSPKVVEGWLHTVDPRNAGRSKQIAITDLHTVNDPVRGTIYSCWDGSYAVGLGGRRVRLWLYGQENSADMALIDGIPHSLVPMRAGQAGDMWRRDGQLYVQRRDGREDPYVPRGGSTFVGNIGDLVRAAGVDVVSIEYTKDAVSIKYNWSFGNPKGSVTIARTLGFIVDGPMLRGLGSPFTMVVPYAKLYTEPQATAAGADTAKDVAAKFADAVKGTGLDATVRGATVTMSTPAPPVDEAVRRYIGLWRIPYTRGGDTHYKVVAMRGGLGGDVFDGTGRMWRAPENRDGWKPVGHVEIDATEAELPARIAAIVSALKGVL